MTEYVGTGAYKFVEWKQDQYVHLIRYEDYVAAHGRASGYTGKVSAPTKDIYYQFVTEASTRVSGFETGEYDIAGEIPTENYHDFDGNDDVKLYTHNAGVLTAFLNMNEGIFADEEIRKCALMAIRLRGGRSCRLWREGALQHRSQPWQPREHSVGD